MSTEKSLPKIEGGRLYYWLYCNVWICMFKVLRQSSDINYVFSVLCRRGRVSTAAFPHPDIEEGGQQVYASKTNYLMYRYITFINMYINM